MRSAAWFWRIPSILAVACGCGSGSEPGDADADTDSDTDVEDFVRGDEECATCAKTPSCGSDEWLSCCVCVPAPSEELLRTSCDLLVDDEFCGEGAPDLGCFAAPPEGGSPEPMLLRGTLDVFGNGVAPDAVTITVYEEEDGGLGAELGTGVSDVAACAAALGEDVDACVAAIESGQEDDCLYCVERDPGSSATNPTARLLAYYEVAAEIPTHTPLVVVTSGNPGLWKSLYSFNVVLGDADLRDGAAWYEARVLSVDDYELIPATAGVGRIEPGRGALAGEVHDCADVRLAYAQVNTEPDPPGDTRVIYFNGDDEHPLPVASRFEGTDALGLYAAMNLAAGPVDVSAVGFLDGEGVSLGWYRAAIFPDSVTAVTLRGLRYHQVRK